MLSREEEVAVDRAGQSCRIISGAMIGGLVSFGAVALVLIQGGSRPFGDGAVSLPAILFWVLGLVPMALSFIFQPRSQSTALSTGQTVEESLKAFTGKHLVATAMREAGGLLGAIGVLLTSDITLLALPVVAALLIASTFPTRDRVLAALGRA